MNNETRNKGITRVILSIIPGVSGSIASFFMLIFLFMALGLFGWSDGGDPKFLRRLEAGTNITLIVSIAVAIIVFIVIIKTVNQRKTGR